MSLLKMCTFNLIIISLFIFTCYDTYAFLPRTTKNSIELNYNYENSESQYGCFFKWYNSKPKPNIISLSDKHGGGIYNISRNNTIYKLYINLYTVKNIIVPDSEDNVIWGYNYHAPRIDANSYFDAAYDLFGGGFSVGFGKIPTELRESIRDKDSSVSVLMFGLSTSLGFNGFSRKIESKHIPLIDDDFNDSFFYVKPTVNALYLYDYKCFKFTNELKSTLHINKFNRILYEFGNDLKFEINLNYLFGGETNKPRKEYFTLTFGSLISRLIIANYQFDVFNANMGLKFSF